MKEQFEKSLVKVEGALKSYEKAETEAEKAKILKNVKNLENLYLQKGVWEKESSVDVVLLQQKKHEIMKQLHEKLKQIDEGENVQGFQGETELRTVSWDAEEDKAVVELPKGGIAKVTRGEILTDPEWGIWYEMDSSVPRAVRKQFVLDDARKQILELADLQIAKTEVAVKAKPGHEFQRSGITEAYRVTLENRANDELKPGIVAERIVKTLFKKLIIDCGLPLEIKDADVSQDIEWKSDFYIVIPKRVRGVKVDETEDVEEIAIQFTTNPDPEVHERKMKQVEKAKQRHSDDTEHADDIILVTLPIIKTAFPYINWMRKGMPAGGMTNILEQQYKEQIFKGVLQGLFPQNEINDMWDVVLGKKPKMEKPKHEYSEDEKEEEVVPEEKPESGAITADFSEATEEEAPNYEKQELSEEAKAAVDKFNAKFGKFFKKK